MPQSPLERLPQNHLAYFVLDVLEQLDLTLIERKVQSKDHRGERPYSPRMMTALLYGYTVGVFSSRKIDQATQSDVAFRVLAGEEHPHFTTVNCGVDRTVATRAPEFITALAGGSDFGALGRDDRIR